MMEYWNDGRNGLRVKKSKSRPNNRMVIHNLIYKNSENLRKGTKDFVLKHK